jgi:hypothetical protein
MYELSGFLGLAAYTIMIILIGYECYKEGEEYGRD